MNPMSDLDEEKLQEEKPQEEKPQDETNDADKRKKAMALEIAEKFRALAKSKGLSVRGALADMGIQLNFVSSMASRGTIPSADSLLQVANYFGVSLDYLVGNPGKSDEFALLDLGFIDILKRHGLNDNFFKQEEDRFLYLEWLEAFTEIYLKTKKLGNPGHDGEQGKEKS
jgi:transcriptional regulator with XRE-family HTH domain